MFEISIAKNCYDLSESTHTLERETKEEPMYLAIAVESKQHPRQQNDYRVWYLEIDHRKEVIAVGSKSKQEMLKGMFQGQKWRAFPKGADSTRAVEIFDFVAKNSFENTHFGNLPTLSEFQSVLDTLQSKLEIRSVA